ncbi:low-density lipoprotein receptor class A domain-containing protein 1 [Protopterus annectens]|uniref:low-density lipoprotein receptor class A domain-containing protein 1 n=1 Tax=Protopterus annectens TaxID=7888 RepID=UPI001CFB5AB3|nr:low-density lipoprotein receptor class A domain-containing protein 1 [Protopterus annectens]
MTRIHPQRRSIDASSFGSTVSTYSEKDCYEDCTNCKCCTRRCILICVVAFLVLGTIVAAVACVIIFALPQQPPVNRYCAASSNQAGFLCDDRTTCIEASELCNRIKNCLNGEDEDADICSNAPNNLPGYLIFRCADPRFWIFIDKKCNGINDCGDCSDESGQGANCPACGSQWWTCVSVFYQYCNCIPRSLCRDGIQHCSDWSDEFTCTN